jgi:hypothetical protein
LVKSAKFEVNSKRLGAVDGPDVTTTETRPESLVYHAHQNWYFAHSMGRQSAHLGNPGAPWDNAGAVCRVSADANG